jgi:hypothetical protein
MLGGSLLSVGLASGLGGCVVYNSDVWKWRGWVIWGRLEQYLRSLRSVLCGAERLAELRTIPE